MQGTYSDSGRFSPIEDKDLGGKKTSQGLLYKMLEGTELPPEVQFLHFRFVIPLFNQAPEGVSKHSST